MVLDNFRIHGSRSTRAALASWHGRIRLHFLPPYGPLKNKIERPWQDFRSNVPRNHTCANMDAPMHKVRDDRWPRTTDALTRLPCHAA